MTTTKLYGPYYDQNAYLEDSRILYLLLSDHPPDADNNAVKELYILKTHWNLSCQIIQTAL